MSKTNIYNVTSKSEKRNEFCYMENKGPKFGVRFGQILLVAFGMGINLSTNFVFATAVVAMTDKKTSSISDAPIYDWDNVTVVMSAILWGGIAVNVLAGYLGKQYGPKWFIVGASLLNCSFFMFIPLAAQWGSASGVIVCRFLQGVALGFFQPSYGVVAGRWIPPEERSRATFIEGGIVTLFAMLASIAAGLIAPSKLGWPWIFYSLGIVGIAWVVIYIIFGVQSAEVHPKISPEEKTYIQKTLFEVCENENTPTPWKKIITSIHVWAIVVGITGFTWNNNIVVTEMSIYLYKVMQFELQMISTLLAIAPLVGLLSGIITAIFSDMIPRRGYLSIANSRRFFHTTGVVIVSMCLIGMTFVPLDKKWWIPVFMCTTDAFLIFSGIGGAAINICDLSPKYSGVISGFCQMASQAVTLFAPLTVQWICTDQSDASEWRWVFLLSAVISIGSSIFFCLFASGTRQNWDDETRQSAEILTQKNRASVLSLPFSITSPNPL